MGKAVLFFCVQWVVTAIFVLPIVICLAYMMGLGVSFWQLVSGFAGVGLGVLTARFLVRVAGDIV